VFSVSTQLYHAAYVAEEEGSAPYVAEEEVPPETAIFCESRKPVTSKNRIGRHQTMRRVRLSVPTTVPTTGQVLIGLIVILICTYYRTSGAHPETAIFCESRKPVD
jgi:hypothetical protein